MQPTGRAGGIREPTCTKQHSSNKKREEIWGGAEKDSQRRKRNILVNYSLVRGSRIPFQKKDRKNPLVREK